MPGAGVGRSQAAEKGEGSSCRKRSDEKPQIPQKTDAGAASLLVNCVLAPTGLNEDACCPLKKNSFKFEQGCTFNNY